ncbi:MAG: sel1 repeat family protein [Saccharospirillaceae bacterium]|nr:hypothetical protein [Pseudomonadales bacterium]NRB80706.1 sel1 repeat family protein [Saccharospirillaceae bacterium]
MNASQKELAGKLFDNGETDQLSVLLLPFVEKKDPFALNLFASFSQPNELISDFDIRYIKQKIEASELGSADASYRMGVNYLNGDDVDQDLKAATKYFERAVSQGHSHTKFTFGFSLYYGVSGNKKNESRGLKLLKEAENEGIDLAKKELELIRSCNT